MNNQSNQESSTPLRKAIQQQVASKHIHKTQLEKLMSMQESVLEEQNLVVESHKGSNWRNTAAAFTLVVFSLFSYLYIGGSSLPDYSREIALEVVENHLKLKPLDVNANSIIDIRNYFTQLDFAPTNSNLLETHFSLSENSITGGRYCSIKGVTAAQLRYQSDSDQLNTLYEVYYEPELFGQVPNIAEGNKPLELEVKGLTVFMWVEKDLLMVLVK